MAVPLLAWLRLREVLQVQHMMLTMLERSAHCHAMLTQIIPNLAFMREGKKGPYGAQIGGIGGCVDGCKAAVVHLVDEIRVPKIRVVDNVCNVAR